MTPAHPPTMDSLLLGSSDPERLRAWYMDMFGAAPDPDGFLTFGNVVVLIEGRPDVGPRAAEPGRVILNYTVTDLAGTARELDRHGVTWHAVAEYREDAGAWFATVVDPDGNYVQLIELTPLYWTKRRERHAGSPLERSALLDAAVGVRLPAQDLDRARRFYSERLGLDPAESRDGGLRYTCGGDSFVVFQSSGRPSGEHTQMGFSVPDLESTMAELRARGLEFDEVQMAGAPVDNGSDDVGGIVAIAGHYPSSGAVGERAVWFRDSEGNVLGLSQLVLRGQ